MTFWYDEDEDELVGNNIFHESDWGTIGEQDGDTLRIDVETIMEDGRGMKKLKEIRDAVEGAMDAHSDDE